MILTGGWGNEIGNGRHPISFRFRDPGKHPSVCPDDLVMGRSWARRRIAMGLDDRVVLWKPHPSHLASQSPREWPLVSPIPFLNPLREDVWSEMGLESVVIVNPPCIWEQHVVRHVLPD